MNTKILNEYYILFIFLWSSYLSLYIIIPIILYYICLKCIKLLFVTTM